MSLNRDNDAVSGVNKRRAAGVTRRRFLHRCGAAAAAVGFPSIIPASALGLDGYTAPSNRVALGFVGLGREGKLKNLKCLMAEPDVAVVALCEVLGKRLKGAHLAMQTYARDPAVSNFDGCFLTGDWREVVSRPDVDAVVVATPDHWHALVAVGAMEAGKDVLCEKPISLTIRQGRVMCETKRRYGSVFQTGSEFRAMRTLRLAAELARNGRIGKLHTIRVDIRNFAGNSPAWNPAAPPADFDYDMWLGPAPDAPYTPLRYTNFRFISDYGGGNLTEMGPHVLSIAQWANGTELTGPVRIDGLGVFPTQGLYDTPSRFEVTYEYANGTVLICRTGEEELEKYANGKIRFEGSDGWIEATGFSIEASSPAIASSVIEPGETHMRVCRQGELRDFLNCIKTRCSPFAPVEEEHRTASVCHLGNISMRLGRKLEWDPVGERFVADGNANRLLWRAMRAPWHLNS
ncbi:MAG: Gfo/Idh/MocA family oxidoreductase [Candidatus Hydrogenedentes bacterium]|nr:Gfo/Idh/MocA family oxidoreductase [Candidatus Hydrogenedentota bacterium]